MNLEKQQLLSLSTLICKEPAARLSTDAFVVLFITSPAKKALYCYTLIRCQRTAGGYSETNCSVGLIPMMFGPLSFHNFKAAVPRWPDHFRPTRLHSRPSYSPLRWQKCGFVGTRHSVRAVWRMPPRMFVGLEERYRATVPVLTILGQFFMNKQWSSDKGA